MTSGATMKSIVILRGRQGCFFRSGASMSRFKRRRKKLCAKPKRMIERWARPSPQKKLCKAVPIASEPKRIDAHEVKPKTALSLSPSTCRQWVVYVRVGYSNHVITGHYTQYELPVCFGTLAEF